MCQVKKGREGMGLVQGRKVGKLNMRRSRDTLGSSEH